MAPGLAIGMEACASMGFSNAVTCAIVTFNSEMVIGDCLASLLLQVDGSQVLVYDNASQDETLLRVAEASSAVRVICGSQNIGFGRAVNALRPEVRTPYLLLLNPDGVMQPGAIEELADLAENLQEVAVLGAVQLTPDGRYVGPEPSEERYREVDCIFGAAMLLRLAAFPSHSPLFDPRFWMYYEDSDLCLSALRRGHKIVLANHAIILHEPGCSSRLVSPSETMAIKRRQYLEYLISGRVFAFKHKGKARALASAGFWMVAYYLQYVFLFIGRHPQRYPMYQKSLACALFYRRVFA
jgi:N-acetylglucosaminyl-diphospho-decaprenol L-rhamnosyltransferase